jgi:hypothetical protein
MQARAPCANQHLRSTSARKRAPARKSRKFGHHEQAIDEDMCGRISSSISSSGELASHVEALPYSITSSARTSVRGTSRPSIFELVIRSRGAAPEGSAARRPLRPKRAPPELDRPSLTVFEECTVYDRFPFHSPASIPKTPNFNVEGIPIYWLGASFNISLLGRGGPHRYSNQRNRAHGHVLSTHRLRTS